MTTPTDHAAIASAYLAACASIASSGAEWAGQDGQLLHASVLANMAVAESNLAIADAISECLGDGLAIYDS